MKLSKRLLAIANMIDDESIVFDIGCDHALLDIYLTLNYKKIKCVACDINENALLMAKKNIAMHNLTKKIETIISNGIDNVDINDNSIIVISGMGASTMIQILDNPKSHLAKKIILQSNNDLYKLRQYMNNKGYIIDEELSVFDKGKYYVIMSFKKGKIKYNDIELLLGPIIIKNKEKNEKYLNDYINKEQNIYNKIPKKYFILKIKTYLKIKKIMAVLK